jgi:hypothetical protein
MLVLADDPEPAPDLDAECEEAVAGLGAVIRRAEAALDALRAPGPHPDGLQIRVQDLNTALIHLAGQAAELRDAEDRRARAVEEDLASRPLAAGLYQAGREDEHAELVAAGWRPPRARHAQRSRRSWQPQEGQETLPGLRRIQGAALPAAVAVSLHHAVRSAWAWAAHHTVLAAAAAVAVPAVAIGAATAVPAVVHAVAGPPAASVPAPAASVVDADPIASTSPASSGRPSPDAKTAHKAAVRQAPPFPGSSSSPAPPGSPASQAPPQGSLTFQEDTLLIGPAGTGTLTLYASGGPVTWQASATDPLTLPVSSGTIPDGHSVEVQVMVPGGTLAGEGSVTVNGTVIPVTWTGLPVPLPTGLLP